jgi:thiosulfate/3-mercaptopyruvate sulfurtransferase
VSEIALEELSARLGDGQPPALVDVRTAEEYDGMLGYPCDPRQGHIPGARRVDLAELVACASVEAVRQLVELPEGAEVVAYCHSGSRSALAVQVLRAAGYSARNYPGSWHEWSRADLPAER